MIWDIKVHDNKKYIQSMYIIDNYNKNGYKAHSSNTFFYDK
jgi:hypothetical protein